MPKSTKNADSPITEADIEVRIGEALRVVFPSLAAGRISHQKTFSVHLGREAIKINGTKTDRVRGRLDILVELDGKPLAILEIKKPGEALDNRVTKQGLSYARILDSPTPPPLVITTNGRECQFFRVWDGSAWEATNRDEQTFQSLFAEATAASAEDLDRAVQHLLQTVPEAWIEVLRQYTRDEIASITGDMTDFSKPVATNFNIPRKAMLGISEALKRGHNKVALLADPFAGKTNLFASLCSLPHFDEFCFLYVNLANSSEGIFDRIASAFMAKFYHTFSQVDVKRWIVDQLTRSQGIKLVVLADGLDSTDPANFRKDLDILARHADKGILSLVISGNRDLIDGLASVRGTQHASIIGRNLSICELTPLDDQELNNAAQILYTKWRAVFEQCADLVPELRMPRILRLLASVVNLSDTSQDNHLAMLWTVCGPRWFEGVWEKYSTDEVRAAYFKLAEVFLDEGKATHDPGDNLRAKLFGALEIKGVEQRLDSNQRQWMCERGLLQRIFRMDGMRFYLPKIPELLVMAAAHLIAEETTRLFNEGKKEAAAHHLLTKSANLPYEGIACALVLMLVSYSNTRIGSALLLRLLDSPPESRACSADAKMATLRTDGTAVTIDLSGLPDAGEGKVMSNLHPWLALSYFISLPMVGTDVAALRMEVIEKVGSCPFPLTGVHQSAGVIGAFEESHNLPGDITVLCGRSALLEPIIRAIYGALIENQEEMEALCQKAVGEGNIPLIHRLLTGARGLVGSADSSRHDAMMKLADKLEGDLNVAIDAATSKVIKKPRSGNAARPRAI